MTLNVDTPCVVTIRPGRDGKSDSVTLDVIGGSLWFPRAACPASLVAGTYKSAVLDVSLRTVRVENGVRSVFAPVGILSVGAK